jgi:hypothetical protein
MRPEEHAESMQRAVDGDVQVVYEAAMRDDNMSAVAELFVRTKIQPKFTRGVRGSSDELQYAYSLCFREACSVEGSPELREEHHREWLEAAKMIFKAVWAAPDRDIFNKYGIDPKEFAGVTPSKEYLKNYPGNAKANTELYKEIFPEFFEVAK